MRNCKNDKMNDCFPCNFLLLLRLQLPMKSAFMPWRILWAADPSKESLLHKTVSLFGGFFCLFVCFFITLRNSRHWDWGQQNKNFLSPPLNFYFTFRYQPTSPCADFWRERFHHHADLALQDGNYLWLPDWSHAHILIHRLHTHSEDHRTQLALLCHHR